MLNHPAKYWSPLPLGRILCELCPRECKLSENQRGLCFVRMNQNGQMTLSAYGRASGFCVDPIEKKPLNHFLPGSPILSFGTAGCNLTCDFCQNWNISTSRQMDRLQDSAAPQSIANKAQKLGCLGVAYTYNDPVIFLEYAVDTAKACRALNLKNVAVTAGYISEKARADFFKYMDAANIDLKAYSKDFYKKICGADLDTIKETLRYLIKETKVWTEITTLLIPGENDSQKEIAAMSQWIAAELGPDVPLHFSAFHPDFKMTHKECTPKATLVLARDIALDAGLNFVYTGNVHHQQGDTTFCPACGKTLIVRDWYKIRLWSLQTGGHCACGKKIPGLFSNRPGEWGSRRLPVQMNPED